MSNGYYNGSGVTIQPYTTARGEVVAGQFGQVASGFEKLPSPEALQYDTIGYLTDTGTANVLVAAFDKAPASYLPGMTVQLVVAATSTGAATININNLGPMPIVRADGSALSPGDLTAGTMIELSFDGTVMRLIGGGNVVMNERLLAQAAANSALFAPGTSASSTTSNALSAGSKTFNIEIGKLFNPGQTMVAADATNPLNQMTGVVLSHNNATGVIVINMTAIAGTGTKASWILSLSASAIASYGSVTTTGLATGSGSTASAIIIDVPAAVASDVLAGTSVSKAVTPGAIKDAAAFQTLAVGTTIAWNTNLGFNASITLDRNSQIGAPSNLKDGWTYTLKLVQGTGGGFAPTWNAIWDWGEAGTPVASTAAGKVDYATAIYDATAGKLIGSFRKAA